MGRAPSSRATPFTPPPLALLPPLCAAATIYNDQWPYANADTWSYLRASAATLYLGFIFALFAALFGLGQLVGCLPVMGTRVMVLYCTTLAFVWGLIGTAIGGARMSSDVVPTLGSKNADGTARSGAFSSPVWSWGPAFGCAIAGTVIAFVNISFAFYSGAAASAEHAPLQGTLSFAAAPDASAAKAPLEGESAVEAGIKMRSLETA